MSLATLPRGQQIAGYREFVGNIGGALRDARTFRGMARHWRSDRALITRSVDPPIYVGAVALGMNLKGSMRWFFAANQNLEPGDNPSKVCAEPVVLQKMDNHDFPFLIGMVVMGTPQPDTHSGRSSLVLPPCGNCRPLLADFGDDEYALVVQAHPKFNLHEIHTPGELQVVHDQSIDSGIDYVSLHPDGEFNQHIFDLGVQGSLSKVDSGASLATIACYAMSTTIPAHELIH